MSDYWFCVILLCAALFGGKWYFGRVEAVEVERTRKVALTRDDYISGNPVGDDKSAILARQAEDITALKEQLEDAEHKEQMLLFELNATAKPQASRRQATGRIYDAEPEIIPPSHASDAISELYDD